MAESGIYDLYIYDDIDYDIEGGAIYTSDFSVLTDSESGEGFWFSANEQGRIGHLELEKGTYYISFYVYQQENMNALVEALQKHGYDAEAEEVIRVNIACRDHIMKYFDLLPRCVYQGDLNRSNILIDKNKHFTGIIDFNMYGTEVNVNCFLNESMYYLDEQDFETMTATELFERMNEVQKKLLIPIFKYYILNEVEKKVYRDYKKIIDLCFYPNVMLWIYLIENHKYEDKVIQLIRFLARDKGQIES